jgi:hypothetical protein
MSTRAERHAQLMFDQRDAHLGHLPGEILRDMARNESAPKEWRKAAVQIMLDKKIPYTSHPDIAWLVQEIQAESEARDEVESIVETAIEGPIQVHNAVPAQVPTGPFKASFTTANQ